MTEKTRHEEQRAGVERVLLLDREGILDEPSTRS
jgi:hypothetical protein